VSEFELRSLLIEYGSGAGIKTRVLLDALERPVAYVPIDIACDQLAEAAGRLQERYPALEVRPICADYTDDFELPKLWTSAARRAVFFPGSTIGNFHPADAEQFMRHVRKIIGGSGALLLGVDLKKDSAVLERAYNDAAGVTAAFNLNLLTRLNRELGGDVLLDRFRHRAVYDAQRGRIEMHLVSVRPQSFQVAGQEFTLSEGEAIHTEYSYKYSLAEFRDLAARSRFEVRQVWTDPDELFSVQFLEAA